MCFLCRRTLLTLLSDLYTGDMLTDGYMFCDSAEYVCPLPSANLASHITAMKSLPPEDAPWLFGLHENASVAAAIAESTDLCATALHALPQTRGVDGGRPTDDYPGMSPVSSPGSLLTPSPTGPLGSGAAAAKALRTQAGGGPTETVSGLSGVVADLLRALPPPFDSESIAVAHPPSYAHSMNVMLGQETNRYNRLLALLAATLTEVKDAVMVRFHARVCVWCLVLVCLGVCVCLCGRCLCF